ncbi:hypothetical protein CAPTEDRAFT_228921 [Capitella teleta]|uniref:SUEL-type lectin domain-containing protein n=1 Tax=Capitella teleta TaxID=283909 RepID=R7TTM5_CAPTE|nr:hypothetical protein CAPTEDRAFT_228921 [Capitella teleta]|eukprot:ELT96967.1 hypothetical protein CAPTEDRAFT_228921 [Capitella teleta]
MAIDRSHNATRTKASAVIDADDFDHMEHLHRFNLSIMSEIQDVCVWQTFNASCPGDSVVLMTSAQYGRMKIGTCMSRDHFIGCASNVISLADERCSGRRQCSISVPNQAMHEIQPCPKDLGSYLEAAYQCVNVVSGAGRICHPQNQLLVNASSPGYLSSVVTDEVGLGTHTCPWVLTASPGQRINLTLLDFSVEVHKSKDDPSLCPVYATIKEANRRPMRDTPICGGNERQKKVYTSESNQIRVQMASRGSQDDKFFFMIKYEVVGCPDLPKPSGDSWVSRSGDMVVIGCNQTGDRWHLVCRGSTWVGEFKNCSGAHTAGVMGDPKLAGFPFGLIVSVVVGIILGVIIGTSLLVLVLACRKRRRHQAASANEFRQTPYSPYGPESQYNSSALLSSGKWPTSPSTTTRTSGYAHIWELKNPQGTNNGLSSNVDAHGVAYVADTLRPGDTMEGTPRPKIAREHIYESPKFQRKEISDGTLVDYPAGMVPYYHEFDPDRPDRHPTDGKLCES